MIDAKCPVLRERRLAFDAARQQWPGLSVSFDQFCQHLSSLGYQHELPTHTSSIFLCLACGHGCESACELLESKYFAALRVWIGRISPSASAVDDILQLVRQRLLVGAPARINSYNGRGSLNGWLRRVASNLAIDFRRSSRSPYQRPETWMAATIALEQLHSSSPEEELFQSRYLSVIQAALSRSIRALAGEERMLLHHHFVSGLGIDALGCLYAIDRSTAARRISRNLARIRKELQRELKLHFGHLEPGELERWAPALYSRLVLNPQLLLAV